MGEKKENEKDEIEIVDVDEVMRDILKELRIGSKDEAIAKSVGDLTDEAKMELMSNLYPFEDDELSIIKMIGSRYKIPFLIDYVETKLRLRCSVTGWKSEQIVRIASEKRKEAGRFGFFKRLFKGKEEITEE